MILLILVLLVLLCLAVWGWSDLDRGASPPACILGTLGFVITLTLSFPSQWGNTDLYPTPYLLEKTPYRLIVSAQGLECVYKDAYSVSRADHIKGVNLVVPHNVWGVELTAQRSLEVVFGN